jgi:hypothetical protein
MPRNRPRRTRQGERGCAVIPAAQVPSLPFEQLCLVNLLELSGWSHTARAVLHLPVSYFGPRQVPVNPSEAANGPSASLGTEPPFRPVA